MTAFLKCGDLPADLARVRCPNCHHEMFVAFSCKKRCTCPSCHQKRALLTSIHVAEEVCATVAHRQVVLTCLECGGVMKVVAFPDSKFACRSANMGTPFARGASERNEYGKSVLYTNKTR